MIEKDKCSEMSLRWLKLYIVTCKIPSVMSRIMRCLYIYAVKCCVAIITLEGGGPRVVSSTAAFHEFGVRFPVSAA